MLSDTQQQWLEIEMMLLHTKPVMRKVVQSSSLIRKISFNIISHRYFDMFILIIIILNTIILSLNWYNISADTEFAL